MPEKTFNLPDLCKADLSPSDLEAYRADLTSLCTILEVIPKQMVNRYVGEQRIFLAEGFDQLISGELRGLQVRYLYADKQWLDTLINTQQSIRLVRIEAKSDGQPVA